MKKGLGLDKHPELLSAYFGNYRKLVYLAQTESSRLQTQAQAHADYLDLEYVYHYTGLNPVAHNFSEKIIQWQ